MNNDLPADRIDARGHYVDPVIEAYKKDIDRSLIRRHLRMTVEERLISLEQSVKDLAELRQAAIAATRRPEP